MEERRLDRRSFLKYAGAGSLATISFMMGGTKVTQAQLGGVLEFLGTIPENILSKLPEAIAEINANPGTYLEAFMSEPRKLLFSEFDIDLPFTEYQIIAFDLSVDESPWPKVKADPPFPYPSEVKVGPVVIGFAEGRVGCVVREKS